MHAPPVSGQEWPTPSSPKQPPWLDQLSRGSWLRLHISVFASGSVILLTLNLLIGSGGVWADTAIGAWGVLVLAHGILMIIARLSKELLAEDEVQPIRPASEMRWDAPSTWTLPPRTRDRSEQPAATSSWSLTNPPDGSPAPDTSGEDSHRPSQGQTQPPKTEEKPGQDERVSWQEATNAAWLTPLDVSPKREKREKAERERAEREKTEKKSDDQDDFTPLKLD